MLKGYIGGTELLKAFRKRPLVLTALLIALAIFMIVCIRVGNDFATFYGLGVMSLEKGARMYETTPYTGMSVPYLPHFFLLMAPWALLPFNLSAGLWFSLKFGFLVQLVRKFLLWSAEYEQRARILHIILPLIACAHYLNHDFRLGQVNLLVNALMVFSFLALLKGRPWFSSLLFVLASVKVVPLAILPYFVLRKQWKFLFGVVGWGVVFAIMLIIWFGWDEAASSPAKWLEISLSHKLGLLQVAEIRNQSIFGVVARFATDILDGTQTKSFTLLLDPSQNPATYALITYGICGLLMIGACLWTLRPRSAELNLTEFSVFLVVMLLISPDTRTAHLVHLLLPTYLLVSSVQWSRFRFQDHWWFLIVCIVLLGTARDLVGLTAYHYALYLSPQTLVMLIILAMLLLQSQKIGHGSESGRFSVAV